MKGQNRFLGNNRTSADYNYRFKVILLGDSKVGKSSIVRRLVEETFHLNYQETAYFDTVTKRVLVNMDEVVLLHIFDTAGLDRYNSLQGSYFQGASGFVIVYDSTRRETFENVKEWIKILRIRCTIEHPTIVVVGNKFDGIQESQVKLEEINELREQEKGIIFFNVSARTGFNLNETIDEMCQNMIKMAKEN